MVLQATYKKGIVNVREEGQPLDIYLGGDIMKFGSRLAREYEYKTLLEDIGEDARIYSPIKNDSINDKKSMTEEQNNCLAEVITEADIARLWACDIAVMNPEENAIGTLVETGALYGFKYVKDKIADCIEFATKLAGDSKAEFQRIFTESILLMFGRMDAQRQYYYIDDIRTNHLNEKDFRRSYSINQLLYGMILYASSNNKLCETFDEVREEIKTALGAENE